MSPLSSVLRTRSFPMAGFWSSLTIYSLSPFLSYHRPFFRTWAMPRCSRESSIVLRCSGEGLGFDLLIRAPCSGNPFAGNMQVAPFMLLS